MLLANKVDLIEDGDDGWTNVEAEIENFCKTQGFLAWFKTSAKENIGVCFQYEPPLLMSLLIGRSMQRQIH